MQYIRTTAICIILVILVITLSLACNPQASTAIQSQSPTSPPSQSQVSTTKIPKLLFEDDFSNPSSGWSAQSSADGSGKYENGEFVVSINKTGGITFGNATKIKQMSDFILEVDIRKLSDAAGGQYAIYFRSAGKNQYGFGVTDTGTYLVNKQSEGTSSKLQDWKSSSDIKGGKETNRFKIVCRGAQFEFYANGNKLTSITDDTLKNGIIILTGGSGNPFGAKYSFDNFKLYSFE
jgi:hypothetical protein